MNLSKTNEVAVSKHCLTGSAGLWFLREGKFTKDVYGYPSFLPGENFWPVVQEGKAQ